MAPSQPISDDASLQPQVSLRLLLGALLAFILVPLHNRTQILLVLRKKLLNLGRGPLQEIALQLLLLLLLLVAFLAGEKFPLLHRILKVDLFHGLGLIG